MSSKPSDVARFAVTGGDVDASNISAPSSGLRDTGWPTNAIPSSGNVNYLENIAYRWRKYLSDGAFSGASTFDNTVGITGTLTANSTSTLLDDVGIGGSISFTNFTFTVTGTTLFNAVAHGRHTGDGPVRVSNSGGALPLLLTAGTDYWIIKITADTFKLATSLANALAGTNLSVLDAGTGIQTMNSTGSTVRAGSLTVKGNTSAGNNLTVTGNVSATGVTATNVSATNFAHGAMSKTIGAWGFRPTKAAATVNIDSNGYWSFWAASPNDEISCGLPLCVGDRLLSLTWSCFKGGSSAGIVFELVYSDFSFASSIAVVDTFTDTSSSNSVASVTTRVVNVNIPAAPLIYALRVRCTNSTPSFMSVTLNFDRP